MKRFVEKAKKLQDAYESETGVRPAYPRSQVLYDKLSDQLYRFKNEKVIKDEFKRLEQIDDTDRFDLDIATDNLEGKAGQLLERSKRQHGTEGAEYVFSSWRSETADADGNIIKDHTITKHNIENILNIVGDERYLLKVKFVKEHSPDDWVIQDGYS